MKTAFKVILIIIGIPIILVYAAVKMLTGMAKSLK